MTPCSDEEDDWWLAIKNNLQDGNRRKVFADYLEEREDPRAAGMRALGDFISTHLTTDKGKETIFYSHNVHVCVLRLPYSWCKAADYWRMTVYWSAVGLDAAHRDDSCLIVAEDGYRNRPVYRSIRHRYGLAESIAAMAWNHLSDADKQQILKAQDVHV